MYTNFPFLTLTNNASLNIRDSLNSIVTNQNVSRDQLAKELGIDVQKFDKDGEQYWEQISTTRLDVEALTRDARKENWGSYVVVTNRDGDVRKLVIHLA